MNEARQVRVAIILRIIVGQGAALAAGLLTRDIFDHKKTVAGKGGA